MDFYDVDPPMLVLQFEIDPEFHDLLETSPEDKDRLTDLIRDDGGIGDRLLVARQGSKTYLIDRHRLDIWLKHGWAWPIPEYKEIAYDSRDAIMLTIDREQAARRNQTEDQQAAAWDAIGVRLSNLRVAEQQRYRGLLSAAKRAGNGFHDVVKPVGGNTPLPRRMPKTRDSLAERVGFELTDDFVADQ